ncbi:MAG: DegV family protein [Lachnospiraceae bacterium]|nr:DegV family protein [Lachnospiraceae bacterium]
MFQIITDSMTDLPASYLKEHDIKVVNLKYTIDGIIYGIDKFLSSEEFYSMVRNGKLPTTSQVNPDEAFHALEGSLTRGNEILIIAFSSGMSGTYNSFRIAAEDIKDKYPDADIQIVDSLAASMGQGLLLHYAICMRDSGKSMYETRDWVEDHKNHIIHLFTVDDLNHLYRGGRLSKTAALLGTIVSVKPILHVDEEGKLAPLRNVRGRKKSLIALVDDMENKMGRYKNQNDTVFISHGDCPDDARFVADEIEKRFGKKEILISCLGPVIGGHAGPGTVALFFLGEKK